MFSSKDRPHMRVFKGLVQTLTYSFLFALFFLRRSAH